MRVAVTYEDGRIFQHFGHTQQFKFYDIEGKEIKKEQIISPTGGGHGALAGFLTENGADTLICGGIGGGAQMALAQAGITLYGGVSGSADEAVRALLAGSLNYNPDVRCSHHAHAHGGGCAGHGCNGEEHGGDCTGHSCKEEKHGCPGSRVHESQE